MGLEYIYDKGIKKTWWKSTLLDTKLNPLRQELGMVVRPEPLIKGQYDQEVVKKLENTDFSNLDGCLPGLSNCCAWLVLHFAGIGLEPAPPVVEPLGIEPDYHYHAD